MKRIILFVFLVYCSGIVMGLAIKPNPSILLVLAVAILFVAVVRYYMGRKIFCLVYLFIFFCGSFMSSYRINKLDEISENLKGRHAVVSGQISGEIVKIGNSVTYSVYVDEVKSDNEKFYPDCKINVIDYRNDKKYIVPFNYISIEGEFKESQQLYKNTGLIDYNLNLYKEGICGVFIPYYSSSIVSKVHNERYITRSIHYLKVSIEGVIDKFVDDKSLQILKGILFGDMSGISEDEYKKFQEIGIIHIFAVSGYNIWILFYLLNVVFFSLNNHVRVKTHIIIAVLGVYTIMSGASPSVVRAFVMSAIVLFGGLLKRQSDPLTSLSVAGLLILIYNPLEIIDIGFQLSFIATASIILYLPYLKRIKIPVNNRIKDIIMLTFAVQIGIIPVTIYYFNSIPLLSLLSNIIIVPLISLLYVLGIALCAFSIIYAGAAVITGRIMEYLILVILGITNYMAKIPFASINTISPGILEMIGYYLIVSILFGFIVIKESYRKKIKYLIMLVLLCYIIVDALPSELKVSFIDVGQGDCIFITTPDKKHILIDGGGKQKNKYSNTDIGDDVLKPYLYKHRINNLDMIICTHFHDDHLNGLIPVMDSFKTEKVVIRAGEITKNNASMNSLPVSKDIISKVENGDIIQAGQFIRLYILNPTEGAEADENDSSIVIKLVYKDFSMMFTGDISSKIEKSLCEYDVSADVLKIPHHGSSTSLEADFLNRVNPKAAVICVGNNSFGHPANSTLNKLYERSIKLYRTDINGEIIITTRGRGFEVRTVM